MNPNKLTNWLEDQQEKSDMDVEPMPLDEVGDDWGMYYGNFQRHDGKFFRLIGAKITKAGREVVSWKQPLLEELGDNGVVALVQETTHGKVLITARQEPGNKAKGRVLLGSSFQASSANLEKAHDGKKPPLAEILDMPDSQQVKANEPSDGGRCFEKEVDVRVISVPDENSIAHLVTPNQRWSNIEEVEEAVMLGLCNPYLRDALLMLAIQERKESK